MTKSSLGRGLEGLLATSDAMLDSFLVKGEVLATVTELPLEQVHADPNQPRKTFDESELNDLAESIKEHGIIQPLIVTKTKDNEYMLIAGERRLRASKLAGLKTVTCVVRTIDEQKRLEMAIVENVQRDDLKPLELAAALMRLKTEFSITDKEVAKKVGKGDSTVGNIMRLMNLPPAAKEALNKNLIHEGHARQVLSLSADPAKQQDLLAKIIKNEWSVRRTEQYVTDHKTGQSARFASSQAYSESGVTQKIAKALNTTVVVQPMAKGKGRLIITYKDEADLERISAHIAR
jgi:ParB family transcriptional regulator, chromosome partitioning protein